MTGYIPLPPSPWVPIAVNSDTNRPPDEVVQAIAESTELSTTTAAALAPLDARGRRSDFAVMGDSIAAFDTATARAWHYALAAFSEGLLRHRGVYATPGHDLFGIEADHLPQVLALSPRPGSVVIAGGTNDTGGANRPYVEANSKAALLRITDALEAVGIKPVLWTLPPRDDSTTVNGHVQRWNVWVRSVASARGYALVDSHAALVDDTTGLFKAALRTDAVHPNIAGHQSIAQAAAADREFMAHFTGTPIYLTTSVLDAVSMFASPNRGLFLAGVDGGGRPNGWLEYSASGHTGTIVPDAAIPGSWLEISRTAAAGAAGGGYQYDFSTGFAVGDEIFLAMRFDMIADALSAGFRFDPTLQALTSGNAVISTGKLMAHGGTLSGIVSGRLVLPPNTAKVRINIAVTGTPTIDSRVRIAQVTLVNRSVFGLA